MSCIGVEKGKGRVGKGRAVYLEGVQLLPREAPRHHLPQNDPKGINICGLAIVMLGHHLQASLTAHITKPPIHTKPWSPVGMEVGGQAEQAAKCSLFL